MTKMPRKREQTWTKEFSVGGKQLENFVERLLAQGNVRRLIILKPSGRVLFETSLTAGVAVAAVFTILAPLLTAVGALTALLTEVRVKVIYTGKPPHK